MLRCSRPDSGALRTLKTQSTTGDKGLCSDVTSSLEGLPILSESSHSKIYGYPLKLAMLDL